MFLVPVHMPPGFPLSPGGRAGPGSGPAGPVVWRQPCCCQAGQGNFAGRGPRINTIGFVAVRSLEAAWLCGGMKANPLVISYCVQIKPHLWTMTSEFHIFFTWRKL